MAIFFSLSEAEIIARNRIALAAELEERVGLDRAMTYTAEKQGG